MTHWPELETFLFSLFGALIGGSFGAWTSGYYSEKGKRLATKQDINNVVDQVRAVTRETEVIKAEISGGVWRQQWQLTQKRDCLVRLIDTLENLRVQRASIRRSRGAPDAVQDAIAESRRARALARLLFSPSLIGAMSHLLRSISESPDTPEAFTNSQRRIAQVRDQIVELGKIELGISEERGATQSGSPEKQ